ncbi:MAG TPA: hypothetical protein VNO33_22575, partial [Kofleriaceae bacterium]|nr:hypothetical protein [Kofleriaceae bacterium]
MRRALEFLTRPRNYPWLAVVIAAAVLLPFLGRHGFWEPREIAIADSASRLLKQSQGDESGGAAEEEPAPEPEPARASSKPSSSGVSAEPGISAEPGAASDKSEETEKAEKAEKERAKPSRPRPGESVAGEPRFTERLVAYGIDHLGFAEGGARAPLALLGMLAVMTAFLLGARLANRRAGFLSAMVLLSFPLLVLQSRQLTSDIAAVAGSGLLLLGLAGLALPSTWSALTGGGWLRGAVLACDVAAIALGGLLSLEAAGPLLGLVPPLAGFGIGVLVWYLLERRSEPAAPPPLYVVAIGCASLLAGIAALAWFAHETFTIVPAQEEDRELFGRTLAASREPLPGLGGPWKSKGDVQSPFSAIFEQLGFGLFPWVALAPLALARLALGRTAPATDGAPARAPWAGYALFTWAALAWLIATVAARKVGPVQYPALVPLAVAIALWIDDLLAARSS